MIDAARIPQRLEQGFAEAQGEQVLDRFLAEIMVDPERPLLRKDRGDGAVDLAAGGEVGAERLLEREADIGAGQPGLGQAPDGRAEQAWGGREEDGEAAIDSAELLGEAAVMGGIASIDRGIAAPLEEG